jgi:predicted dithiol-disulfide oxidoreductase (DUF899 family)
MCPACVSASATAVVSMAGVAGAGVASFGGLAALVVRAWTRGTTRPSSTSRQENPMHAPRVASREEWLEARTALLEKEKALTRARDAVSAERRALPMVKVDTSYVFDTPDGPRSLAELFDGRSQLIVYHFMMGPGWKEGCPSCSLLADHIDGSLVHLAHRDVTLAVVSRATLPEINAFKRRMGWKFTWVSSNRNTFNRDYHVSFTDEEIASGRAEYNYAANGFPAPEAPGVSVFVKDASGPIFHTYSSYARGGEPLIGVYQYLDLVPKGRDEDGLAFSMSWVRHHDRYGDGYRLDPAASYKMPDVIPECCAGENR